MIHIKVDNIPAQVLTAQKLAQLGYETIPYINRGELFVAVIANNVAAIEFNMRQYNIEYISAEQKRR